MSEQNALELKDLRRRFGRVQALQGLSLKVPMNSVTAFVGANGAGKTTTFSLIGGFIRPHGGTIEVFGLPLRAFRARGGVVGILPQDMQFFEDRPIARQLHLFARLAGFGGRESHSEVERVLNLVKLSDRAEAEPGDLSHGMRVRLGVAQALIGNPPLVLLDEPTAGLDPHMLVDFRETVQQIRGTITLVISSHDLSELEELCDYACMVDKGKLVMQGPMKQLLSGVSSITYTVEKLTRDLSELEAQVPGIDAISENSQSFVVEFDRSRYKVSDVNRAVLAWLLNHGVEVLEVKQHRSLEQAFLKATGR